MMMLDSSGVWHQHSNDSNLENSTNAAELHFVCQISNRLMRFQLYECLVGYLFEG